jgi:hypothetical protein
VKAEPMSEREYRAITNRQRRLPEQLIAARRRVKALEAECKRYAITVDEVDEAWDREMELAWLANTERLP